MAVLADATVEAAVMPASGPAVTPIATPLAVARPTTIPTRRALAVTRNRRIVACRPTMLVTLPPGAHLRWHRVDNLRFAQARDNEIGDA